MSGGGIQRRLLRKKNLILKLYKKNKHLRKSTTRLGKDKLLHVNSDVVKKDWIKDYQKSIEEAEKAFQEYIKRRKSLDT